MAQISISLAAKTNWPKTNCGQADDQWAAKVIGLKASSAQVRSLWLAERGRNAIR